MTEKFTCPRRIEDGRHCRPNSDRWNKLRPMGGTEKLHEHFKGFRSCSYCGSLHPEDFFTAIEREHIIGPTDKSYKAYVGIKYTDEEFEKWKKFVGFNDRVFPSETFGMTDEDSRLQHDYAKFYFQHLSNEQRNKFIDLLNQKKIKIGYPGRFYRLPFFIAPVD